MLMGRQASLCASALETWWDAIAHARVRTRAWKGMGNRGRRREGGRTKEGDTEKHGKMSGAMAGNLEAAPEPAYKIISAYGNAMHASS